MMDLLEDYLQLRGYPWARIDGTVHWQERQEEMDNFNNDDNAFVFLLSTRAGGLGINLVSADTVLIYDSDFNPQQDLQAQDRCHRIGQKKPVSVFRMCTTNSVETKILERATNKRKLELVAIARKRFKVSDKLENGPELQVLQQAQKTDCAEEKKAIVSNISEIRQTLTQEDLKALLKPKSLEDVNSEIIGDEDLRNILLKRGKQAIEKDGKGWQFIPQAD
eukprot:CAMPEP_0184305160 /NCGR_PEP_ID=MMETSP1049-20130417/14502_1 /TAXON_ID=77928 /ORGANISM="Proteomonas sulcata, Strain CCMP704" /LENGTH=220 /DNA_ID=CAMNT_0026617161 /DNA_START=30 /DNA_END=692 /DNA_ORIENTATION=+